MSLAKMTNAKNIVKVVCNYIVSNHPVSFTAETLPCSDSLLDLNILDSFGFVELVAFLETEWNIKVDDSDITRENLGSIDKIEAFVSTKLVNK